MRTLFTTLLILLSISSFAQNNTKLTLGDRFNNWQGFSVTRLTLSNTDELQPISEGFTYIGGCYGTYFILSQYNDVFSVGADLGVNAGINLGNDDLNFILQVPAFLMVRGGAMATAYGVQNIGMGLGIGVKGSFVNHTERNLKQEPKTWLHPAAIAEISILTFTLRGTMSLGTVTKDGNFFYAGTFPLVPLGTTTPIKSREFSVSLLVDI